MFSTRKLILGEVVSELVQLHSRVFGSQASSSLQDNPGWQPASAASVAADGVAAFQQSYDLGVQLLRAAGLSAPAAVDNFTMGGHLMAACWRSQQLTPVRAPAAPGISGRDDIDLSSACVHEAVLVGPPLLALKDTMTSLLEQWPDHPILLQARHMLVIAVGARHTRIHIQPRLLCTVQMCRSQPLLIEF